MADYLDIVDSIETREWQPSYVDVNLGKDYPEVRFISSTGVYEVEISPVDGFDAGEPDEDQLEFFVNVFEYRTNEYGDRVGEEEHHFSRKCKTAQEAAKLAESKIEKYD